jgi:hypothetical protein
VPGFPPPSPFGVEEPEEDLESFDEEDQPPFGTAFENASFGGEDLDELSGFERAAADPAVYDQLIDGLLADTTALAAATEEAGAFGRFAAVTSSPLATETDVVLRLKPSAATVAPGQTVEVELTARALAPVSHVPVTLEFDPAVLAVESVTAGPFLGGQGSVEVLSDASRPGRLVLGASRLGDVGGVAGEGVVARVVFRARAAGDPALRFGSAKALDSSRAPLAVATRPVQLSVAGEAPPAGDRPAAPLEGERPGREDPPRTET